MDTLDFLWRMWAIKLTPKKRGKELLKITPPMEVYYKEIPDNGSFILCSKRFTDIWEKDEEGSLSDEEYDEFWDVYSEDAEFLGDLILSCSNIKSIDEDLYKLSDLTEILNFLSSLGFTTTYYDKLSELYE